MMYIPEIYLFSFLLEIILFSAEMEAFSSKEDIPVVAIADYALTASDKHYPLKTTEDDCLAGFKFKPLPDGEKPSFKFKTLPTYTNNPSSNHTTPIAHTSTNISVEGKPVQQSNCSTPVISSAMDVNLAGFRFKIIDSAKENKLEVEKLTNLSKNTHSKDKSNIDYMISKQLESLNLSCETQTPQRAIATAKRTIPKTANTVQTKEPEKKNHLQTIADLDLYTSDESLGENDTYNKKKLESLNQCSVKKTQTKTKPNSKGSTPKTAQNVHTKKRLETYEDFIEDYDEYLTEDDSFDDFYDSTPASINDSPLNQNQTDNAKLKANKKKQNVTNKSLNSPTKVDTKNLKAKSKSPKKTNTSVQQGPSKPKVADLFKAKAAKSVAGGPPVQQRYFLVKNQMVIFHLYLLTTTYSFC